MQALAKALRWHPEHGSGFRGCKPIPGYERECLSIMLIQASERSHDGSVRDLGLSRVVALSVCALSLEP